MLISTQTSEALDELYGAFFDLNATLDRMVSVMLNDFCMPQANKIIHHRLAHLMPLMADMISEIKDNYNVSSIRPEVHRDSRTYSNLKDMFETLLKEFEEVYEMIKMTCDISDLNKDLNVKSDLIDFIRKFNMVIGQIITLKDKAIQMPDDFNKFDRYIDDWGIVGLVEVSG